MVSGDHDRRDDDDDRHHDRPVRRVRPSARAGPTRGCRTPAPARPRRATSIAQHDRSMPQRRAPHEHRHQPPPASATATTRPGPPPWPGRTRGRTARATTGRVSSYPIDRRRDIHVAVTQNTGISDADQCARWRRCRARRACRASIRAGMAVSNSRERPAAAGHFVPLSLAREHPVPHAPPRAGARRRCGLRAAAGRRRRAGAA